MLVSKIDKNGFVEIAIDGSIDTLSAPRLEKFLNIIINEGANNLVINLEKVPYISSAALRTFLGVLKTLGTIEGSSLRLINANDSVKKVFSITGFAALFDFG